MSKVRYRVHEDDGLRDVFSCYSKKRDGFIFPWIGLCDESRSK